METGPDTVNTAQSQVGMPVFQPLDSPIQGGCSPSYYRGRNAEQGYSDHRRGCLAPPKTR